MLAVTYRNVAMGSPSGFMKKMYAASNRRQTTMVRTPCRSGQWIAGSSPLKRQDFKASPAPQARMVYPRMEGKKRGDSALSTPIRIFEAAYTMKRPSRARKQPTTISACLIVFTNTSGDAEYSGISVRPTDGRRISLDS